MNNNQFKIKSGYVTANMVQADATLAAAMAKVVPASRGNVHRDASGQTNAYQALNQTHRIAAGKRVKRNRDANTVLRLLPDLDLAVQILISSIASPSDMMTPEIIFTSPANIFTSEVTAALIGKIREYFETDYPIKNFITDMLKEMAATKGSYPVAVIPENAIDDLINGPVEAISREAMGAFLGQDNLPKHLGILGSGLGEPVRNSTQQRALGLAFEAYARTETRQIQPHLHYPGLRPSDSVLMDAYITITDNPAVLRFPKIIGALKADKIKRAISSQPGTFSMESYLSAKKKAKLPTDRNISGQLLRNTQRRNGQEMSVRVKPQHELNRSSVGRPLVMKFPSEAVLPVYTPGDVTKHIGYFVLIDEEGYAINYTSDEDYYRSVSKGLTSPASGSMTSSLLARVKSNLGTGEVPMGYADIGNLDYAAQVYGDMVEQDLIARIKNGVHSSGVKISSNEEVYRIMLARTLESRFTQLLYLPIEYMTYMTFKYDQSTGMGMSLIDDLATVNTLRTVLMFADVLGAVKNSVGRTDVELTLPEHDPDGLKTIEMARDYIVKGRQMGMPLSIESAGDVTSFLERAGIAFKVKGGGLPELEYEVTNTQTSFPKSDGDLNDMLRKYSIMGTGVPPEMVDQADSAEFATVATANNILFGKRVVQLQGIFNPLLSDHLRKIVASTHDLIEGLYKIIEEAGDCVKMETPSHLKELVEGMEASEGKMYLTQMAFSRFISKFEASLPKPASVTVKEQTDTLDEYAQFLDMALDNGFINENIVTQAVSGNVTNIKAQIKAYFMRKYMSDKGIGTELFDLVTQTEDGNPQLNLLQEVAKHSEALTRSCVANVARTTPVDQAAQADLEQLGNSAQGGSGGGDSGGDSGGDDSSGDGASGGGDDDFGMGDDGMGGDDDTAAPADAGDGTEQPAAGADGADEKKTDDEEPLPTADQ